jgi:hypothetical protein
MAQQIEVSKVNRNAVTAISSAIAKGLREVQGTGSLLTQVCKVAQAMYRGNAIPKADVTAILDDLSARNAWNARGAGKASTDQVRRSEYKSVLNAYHTLPEAMTAFHARTGRCAWTDGIALSRLLNGVAKGNANKAAMQHATRKTAKSAPRTSGDAKASAATAIKRVLKLPHLPRAFLSQLRELCGEYSIRV